MDLDNLLNNMLNAVKGVLSEKWPEVKDYAKTELKGIAEGIILIEKLKLSGQISEEQARLLLDMKRNTAKIVLLTIEGLGLLAVEEAINAALSAVRETVNGALDFVLL